MNNLFNLPLNTIRKVTRPLRLAKWRKQRDALVEAAAAQEELLIESGYGLIDAPDLTDSDVGCHMMLFEFYLHVEYPGSAEEARKEPWLKEALENIHAFLASDEFVDLNLIPPTTGDTI